ncbi:hypothetical protein F5Y09DRAFT_309602 [Xylaria sp. FL1042]|nr:hypothetical protein F5Y09DRAFT_309602 [Xylaria sp. FL1042]
MDQRPVFCVATTSLLSLVVLVTPEILARNCIRLRACRHGGASTTWLGKAYGPGSLSTTSYLHGKLCSASVWQQ